MTEYKSTHNPTSLAFFGHLSSERPCGRRAPLGQVLCSSRLRFFCLFAFARSLRLSLHFDQTSTAARNKSGDRLETSGTTEGRRDGQKADALLRKMVVWFVDAFVSHCTLPQPYNIILDAKRRTLF